MVMGNTNCHSIVYYKKSTIEKMKIFYFVIVSGTLCSSRFSICILRNASYRIIMAYLET